MIFRNIFIVTLCGVFAICQTPDHLIFYKISPGESNGEAVEIYNPTTDEIFIILPKRCFIICLITALVTLKIPFKLTSITLDHCS